MKAQGSSLLTGEKVRIVGAHGIWTVLPLDDGAAVGLAHRRWLGRPDGSLVPIVPEFDYERVG